MLWSREGSYPAEVLLRILTSSVWEQHKRAHFISLSLGGLFVEYGNDSHGLLDWAWEIYPHGLNRSAQKNWAGWIWRSTCEPVSAHVLPSLCMFEWSIIYQKNNNCFGSKVSIDYFSISRVIFHSQFWHIKVLSTF